MSFSKISVLAAAAALALSGAAGASLVITEVQQQTTAGSASTINGDWWELTNAGATSVNLSGYKWADSEDQIGGPTPQPNVFPSVSIAPGESIIILEEATANEAAWRSNWGAPASLNILATDEMLPTPPATDTFSGLSGSGDAVFFYDPSNALLSSFAYTTAVRGTSFEIATDGASLGLSVVGENFAVRATNNDIGSPGRAVPEPTALGAIALAGAALLARRRA